MVKNRYQFNPESVEFEKVKRNFRSSFFKTVAFLFTSALLGITLVLAFSYFFGTPAERELKKENLHLKTQYALLNKQIQQLKVVIGDIQQRDDNLYRVIFESDPIPTEIRKAGMGGVNRYEKFEKLNDPELLISTTRQLDEVVKQTYIQSKSYDELEDLAKRKKDMLASIPAILPIAKNYLSSASSGWGNRIHPIYKINKFHWGMDFPAPTGTDVYATGDGVVLKARIDKSGYGRHVVINHGFGYETLYAHMLRYTVRKGQKIKRGDVIGYVGNSGLSVAPHVHYEVKKDGAKVNPANYYFSNLTVEEYHQLVENASNAGQSLD